MTAAPCASATNATDTEPNASCGIRLKSGSMGAGRLLGTVAIPPTSSIGILNSPTPIVPAASTRIAAYFSNTRMRLKITIKAIVPAATATVVQSHCPMFCNQLMVFCH